MTTATRFTNWKPPRLVPKKGEHLVVTKWGWAVDYPENLSLGDFTDICFGTYINAKYGVKIGERVQIGDHVSIISWSTIDDKKGTVTIKENAKICMHSSIMPGVTIGKNSIVGAFSFVNKDVPDNVTVWGIPARIQRRE